MSTTRQPDFEPRSLGLIGLGLAHNSLQTISFQDVFKTLKHKHHRIVKRERLRRMSEMQERRKLSTHMITDSQELDLHFYPDSETLESTVEEGVVFDVTKEEKDEEETVVTLTPQHVRLTGVLQRTALVRLVCYFLPSSIVTNPYSPILLLLFPLADPVFTYLDTLIPVNRREIQDPEGTKSFFRHLSLSLFVNQLTGVPEAVGAGVAAVAAIIPESRWTSDIRFFGIAAGSYVVQSWAAQMILEVVPFPVVECVASVGKRSLEAMLLGGLIRKFVCEYPLVEVESKVLSQTENERISENEKVSIWQYCVGMDIPGWTLGVAYMGMLVGGSLLLARNGIRLVYY